MANPTKLTPLGKLVIVLALFGAGYFSVKRFGPELAERFGPSHKAPGGDPRAVAPAAADRGVASSPSPAIPRPSSAAAGKTRIVIGVNDFGGAYPGLVANDGALPGPASLFTQAGLDVEIKLVRGSKERLEQFDAGQIDVMLLTLDYVANLYPDYRLKGVDLQAFLFVDWSRGNMGIVTRPGHPSIESLKEARVVTTRNTPTHYFLLTLLDRSNLNLAAIDQIKRGLIFAKKTPDAGEIFQRGEADAVAIWEPYLSKAISNGKGELLVSTRTASNLIADVLFARTSFLDAHAEVMPVFLRVWFEGVKKLHEDPAGSIQVISRAFSQTPEQTADVLGKIKPATFADNRAFFGLETESSPYAALLLEAAQIWQREGLIKELPDPRKVARTKFLDAIKEDYRDEKVLEEWKFTPSKASAGALLSKSVSIYFASGSAEIDADARRAIDSFADRTVSVFQDAYVRVEGNTDAAGGRSSNVNLSERRARAVVDYFVSHYRYPPERFVAVGNGPDRPVADNRTAEGRAANRRTDFRVVPNY